MIQIFGLMALIQKVAFSKDNIVYNLKGQYVLLSFVKPILQQHFNYFYTYCGCTAKVDKSQKVDGS
jgi:hypothetical protein